MIWLPVPHPAIKIFGLELGVESSLQKVGFSMVVSKEMNSAVGFCKKRVSIVCVFVSRVGIFFVHLLYVE